VGDSEHGDAEGGGVVVAGREMGERRVGGELVDDLGWVGEEKREHFGRGGEGLTSSSRSRASPR
jgi:hypothetical protein